MIKFTKSFLLQCGYVFVKILQWHVAFQLDIIDMLLDMLFTLL